MRHRNFMGRLVWLALLLALPAAAVSGNEELQPRAVFPELIHRFGTVLEGHDVTHEFVILNQGTAPLTVNRIDSG